MWKVSGNKCIHIKDKSKRLKFSHKVVVVAKTIKFLPIITPPSIYQVLTMVIRAYRKCPVHSEYLIVLFVWGFGGGPVLILGIIWIKLKLCLLYFTSSLLVFLAPLSYLWVSYSLYHLWLPPIRFSKVAPTWCPSLGWFHVGLVWLSFQVLLWVQK